MSHSHGRQETRNIRWQQRQREENREMNRNRLEHHPQGEHSGQSAVREAENRWENDPAQNYSYPRQSNSEQGCNEYDSRYDSRSRPEVRREPHYQDPENSNREWVSGTGQPPYRGPGPSFAGRGPQGYKRPDDRVTEDINEEMTRNHGLDKRGHDSKSDRGNDKRSTKLAS